MMPARHVLSSFLKSSKTFSISKFTLINNTLPHSSFIRNRSSFSFLKWAQSFKLGRKEEEKEGFCERDAESDPISGNYLEVYSWGRGESGQLGHGIETSERCPRKVQNLFFRLNSQKLPQTSPETSAETSTETSPETATRFSDSDSKSNVSNSNSNVLNSNPIQLDPVNASVRCGIFHSAFTFDGRMWLWGKGDGGRLGLENEHSLYLPTLNEYLPPVRSASLGGLHTLALCEEGELYSFGYGGFGGLGHGVFTRERMPKKIMADWREEDGGIVQISSAGAHNAAITQSGKVYTWGRDEGEGRLGHPDIDTSEDGCLSVPTRVNNLPEDIFQVACGGFFTSALTKQGEIWTWGGNMNHELGLNSRAKFVKSPQKMSNFDSKINHIACGAYHSAAIDEDGKIWTWGRGGSGQLGHKNIQNESCPKIVKHFPGRAKKVFCGGAWTAAINENGEVYVWGKNTEHQLGLNRNEGSLNYPIRLLFPNIASTNFQILDLDCGVYHGLALIVQSY